MYARILVAIDGSELGARALEQALLLAKALGSPMTLVHVTEPVLAGSYAAVAGGRGPIPVVEDATEVAAHQFLEKAKSTAKAAGVEATTVWVANREAAEGIVETAEDVGAELIVMGTNGRRGISRMILGSQTNNVLKHTKLPVLVTR